jgi:hypothetical protein
VNDGSDVSLMGSDGKVFTNAFSQIDLHSTWCSINLGG